MGLKLRQLAATLLSPCSTATASASDAHPAVLRATAHHPSTAPPSPRHLAALLAFGRGSRLAAAAVASALVDRLRQSACGSGDAVVALKCLVAVRLLLGRGAFILRDQLLAALRRDPSSGRNPLALSAFPHGRSAASYDAASWVRFAARLLELLLLLPDTSACSEEHLTSLPNAHLVAELAAYAAVVDAARCAPPPSSASETNGLVWEVVRLAEEDLVMAEQNIAARVKEMGERLEGVGFADAVELVCVLRRAEEGAVCASEWKWAAMDERVVGEIRRLRERVDAVVVRRTDAATRVVRREAAASASARVVVPVRLGDGEPVRSGSTSETVGTTGGGGVWRWRWTGARGGRHVASRGGKRARRLNGA